jgi:serine/threonine-protein kinase TNNI3K
LAPTAPSSNTTAATGIFSQRTILKARIPLDEIVMGDVISQGAFGEVLDGYYKGEAVAVKRLLPSLRDNMNDIKSFLDEAKMLMTLRHTRLVQFIGVAWDAPTDLCIVTELMDGGDLQTMLTRADANYEPTGFDANKVKIALHIIHALSYLHGLTPPIVHRDLKSTNVLLTKNLDAKLTDFGISRERGDSTMTSNVGSWLWMAPEVMLGKQYDEKADIFSFGVVLSELDTQKIPYSHARESGTGRKLPEMVMLNMVSAGRLTVAFSDGADADMVAIGRACVALDPKRRPKASEVLRRIDKIYRRYL